MTFEMTEEHLELVRHFYVGWQDAETGAPEIDPKRPYGNSDVANDIAEILGYDIIPLDEEEGLREHLMELHAETMTALQIILYTGEFKPGSYRRVPDRGLQAYKTREWELAD